MLVDGYRSLRDWWREVEPAKTGLCCECSNPADSILCDKCDKKLQTPPEPRWAYLLDRDDVLVLDTQTTGLDADAEVTDVAVINTRGRVLLYDLRRAGATSYRDVHGPLMRVLDRASTVCVYNAGFDMQIEQSARAAWAGRDHRRGCRLHHGRVRQPLHRRWPLAEAGQGKPTFHWPATGKPPAWSLTTRPARPPNAGPSESIR